MVFSLRTDQDKELLGRDAHRNPAVFNMLPSMPNGGSRVRSSRPGSPMARSLRGTVGGRLRAAAGPRTDSVSEISLTLLEPARLIFAALAFLSRFRQRLPRRPFGAPRKSLRSASFRQRGRRVRRDRSSLPAPVRPPQPDLFRGGLRGARRVRNDRGEQDDIPAAHNVNAVSRVRGETPELHQVRSIG